jgi:hypothetical protein
LFYPFILPDEQFERLRIVSGTRKAAVVFFALLQCADVIQCDADALTARACCCKDTVIIIIIIIMYSRVLHEKLLVAHRAKKFCVLYGIRRLIAMLIEPFQ